MVIAGNWKMHKLRDEAMEYTSELAAWIDDSLTDYGDPTGLQVIVAPPFTTLEQMTEQSPPFGVFAQTMHSADHGAFTGEISPAMLRDIGVDGVLLGHSERRAYCNETDAALRDKVAAALAFQLCPMLCVGEQLEDRQAGTAESVVSAQVRTALEGIDPEEVTGARGFYLAYEPVWAIGTGETATPEIAQQMHAHIRAELTALWSSELSDRIPILYGGSVKPDNASDLLGQADIDGALIGGAALEVESFTQLITAGMRELQQVNA